MPLLMGEELTFDRLREVGEAALVAMEEWDVQALPLPPKRPRGSVVSSGVAYPLNEVVGDLDVDNPPST
jgi:hypothetical protein